MDRISTTTWADFSRWGSDINNAWTNLQCSVMLHGITIAAIGDDGRTCRFVGNRDWMPVDDDALLQVGWFGQQPTRYKYEMADKIEGYYSTPIMLYVANDLRGAVKSALLYNPTGKHILSPEETQQTIDLLKANMPTEPPKVEGGTASKVIFEGDVLVNASSQGIMVDAHLLTLAMPKEFNTLKRGETIHITIKKEQGS